jgi:hypothetical protein
MRIWPGATASARQRAVRTPGGRQTGCHAALTWPCPGRAGSRPPGLAPADGASSPSPATRWDVAATGAGACPARPRPAGARPARAPL